LAGLNALFQGRYAATDALMRKISEPDALIKVRLKIESVLYQS
jgi:hypothetical protein